MLAKNFAIEKTGIAFLLFVFIWAHFFTLAKVDIAIKKAKNQPQNLTFVENLEPLHIDFDSEISSF